LYEALKARKILVRLMTFKDVPTVPGQVVSGLRISIGTDAEIDRLLEELKPLV
jgi:histidinol-phosphate aminotransferase